MDNVIPNPVVYMDDASLGIDWDCVDNWASYGYSVPGWYFWDETWAYCHGPFLTEEDANGACREYAKAL